MAHFAGRLTRHRVVDCLPRQQLRRWLRQRARNNAIACGEESEQHSESRLQNSCGNKIPAHHLANADSVVVFECWVLTQRSIGEKNYGIRRTAMLVLRRRKGEQIIINEVIRIYVAQASEGSCTLSIEAPDSFVIRRGELPPFEKRVHRGISSAIQATK